MKLDWKPVNADGTFWVSTCGRFGVCSDEQCPPDWRVLSDKARGKPLREAAILAQMVADAD